MINHGKPFDKLDLVFALNTTISSAFLLVFESGCQSDRRRWKKCVQVRTLALFGQEREEKT